MFTIVYISFLCRQLRAEELTAAEAGALWSHEISSFLLKTQHEGILRPQRPPRHTVGDAASVLSLSQWLVGCMSNSRKSQAWPRHLCSEEAFRCEASGTAMPTSRIT